MSYRATATVRTAPPDRVNLGRHARFPEPWASPNSIAVRIGGRLPTSVASRTTSGRFGICRAAVRATGSVRAWSPHPLRSSSFIGCPTSLLME